MGVSTMTKVKYIFSIRFYSTICRTVNDKKCCGQPADKSYEFILSNKNTSLIPTSDIIPISLKDKKLDGSLRRTLMIWA